MVFLFKTKELIYTIDQGGEKNDFSLSTQLHVSLPNICVYNSFTWINMTFFFDKAAELLDFKYSGKSYDRIINLGY